MEGKISSNKVYEKGKLTLDKISMPSYTSTSFQICSKGKNPLAMKITHY